MRFTPKSDEELLNLLPEGEYDFFVKAAQDTTSKSGNEMFKLTLGILDNQNIEHVLYDYLLEAMAFKLKHFSQAIGIEDKYNAGGYMAADCIGKVGKCYVTKQEAKDGFQAKNTVADYIKASDIVANTDAPKPEDFNDDLPF